MKNLSILIILITSILSISCDRLELSNSEAEKLIKKNLVLPRDFTIKFSNKAKPKLFNTLTRTGMITWEYKWTDSYGSTSWDCDIKVSVRAKPFFISESPNGDYIDYKFKAYTLDFKTITGISINKEDQTALVRYTLKTKDVTRIAEILQNTEHVRHSLKGDINGEIVFKKFDTGWQLH